MGGVISRGTTQTLNVALVNKSSSATVYAYITGQAINNNNKVFLLQADGKTPYYPTSPSATGSPLAVDCGIRLGGPGTKRIVTIPRVAGGRIWFCINDRLTFLLNPGNPGNPGPGLVEPSVSNQSDPNYNKAWDFCEFTFNQVELFVNITYVDFVSLPIGLTLLNTAGASQSVAGLPANGFGTVCSRLVAQNNVDGAGWNQLIVKAPSGGNLRALSPNAAHVMNNALLRNYYTNYVNDVWNKYTNTALTINTQAQWGNVTGRVVNNLLTFPGVGSFSKPSAADIFSCSTGPFAAQPNNTAQLLNIGARLAAAFNRSTLLLNPIQPNGEIVANYNRNTTTNHYSRILHEVNVGGRGYAFPYDDVAPSGGQDQSGSVSDGSPALLTVSVGGLG